MYEEPTVDQQLSNGFEEGRVAAPFSRLRFQPSLPGGQPEPASAYQTGNGE